MFNQRQDTSRLFPTCRIIIQAKSEPLCYLAEDYFKWLNIVGRTKQVAGIFTAGEVLSFPERWLPLLKDDERFNKYHIGHPWDKLTPEDYWFSYKYTDNLAINPLLQETIWEKLDLPNKTDLGWFKGVRRR
jgi:hypothetical protein